MWDNPGDDGAFNSLHAGKLFSLLTLYKMNFFQKILSGTQVSTYTHTNFNP